MPRFKRILLAHTAVVAATLAVGLMLAFAGISYYLITRQSTGLEIQETKDRVRGIVNEMSQPLKTLQARANDWAARDQTSQFIGNSAPSGTDAQLQQDSFHDLQADVILLLNPKGHLVYSRFFDPQKHQLIAEDSEVLQTISDKTTFVQALSRTLCACDHHRYRCRLYDSPRSARGACAYPGSPPGQSDASSRAVPVATADRFPGCADLRVFHSSVGAVIPVSVQETDQTDNRSRIHE